MKVDQAIDSIRSREDFVSFVRMLLFDLRDNAEEWENNVLESYLEAIAAWVDDMEGYYQNRGEPVPEYPTWKTFAEILLAAKIYE